MYEGAGIELIRWLRRHGHAPEGALVDIGANIGVYAVSLSPEFTQVIAFEPNPSVFRLLQFNIDTNGCDNVNAHCVALSANAGTARLSEPVGNAGAAKLAATNQTERAGYEVRLVAGDDYLKGLDAPISVIKIDVEGHEVPALTGLQTLIQRDRPLVCFEANDPESYSSIRALLSGLGYTQFYGLDFWPSLKLKWLKVVLLTLIGVRHRLNNLPLSIDAGVKYSLVVATSQMLEV